MTTDRLFEYLSCIHMREMNKVNPHISIAAFSFDVDIWLDGPRYGFSLCEDCYNRLKGTILQDIIDDAMSKHPVPRRR